jgi:pimeloyl-ACP methyl ester carboxylesterase
MRWLLLRGWTREARHWLDFPRLFADRCAGCTVTAIDLPGSGARWAERSPSTVRGITDRVRSAVDPAGNAPWHIVGLSLGGMVAVDWSSRFPAEVAGCVLINTSLPPFCSPWQRLRPANYPTLLRLLLLPGDPLAREATILRLTTRSAPAALAASFAAYASERPPARANALRQLLAAARFRAPAAPPAVPLLLLAGACDRLVDPACSAALARAWNAPLAVHPTAAHDVALDDPAWIAERIAEWSGGLAQQR